MCIDVIHARTMDNDGRTGLCAVIAMNAHSIENSECCVDVHVRLYTHTVENGMNDDAL